MLIKAYLFSKIARQIGHTYYSVPSVFMGASKFYYYLKDYRAENLLLNESFIYEIEIHPETIFICSEKYLEARKYKIIRHVGLIEYLEEIDLPSNVKKELNDIFNCSNSNLLEKDFYDLFNRKTGSLSPYEKLKVLAILNRVQGNFPIVTLKETHQIHYIKLLEFYRIHYDYSEANIPAKDSERKRIFGNNEFEIINSQTNQLFESVKKDSQYLSTLVLGRKLTQKQFEDMCDLAAVMNIGFGRFFVSAIISGYKIQPQHEKLFYPFIIYHNSEKIESWIKNKIRIGDLEKQIALENNYMIDGVRYWNSYHRKVYETKKIFLKEGFKVIERN